MGAVSSIVICVCLSWVIAVLLTAILVAVMPEPRK